MDGQMERQRLFEQVMRPARAARPTALDGDPRRRFQVAELATCSRCKGRGTVGGYTSAEDDWEEDAFTCGECGTVGQILLDSPIVDSPPAAAVIALTLDVEGVMRAEAAARTAIERLAVWGVPKTDRIVWRIGGPVNRPNRDTNPHPRAEVLVKLLRDQWTFSEWWALFGALGPGLLCTDPRSLFLERAAWHLTLSRAWCLLAEREFVVPSSIDCPQAVGHLLADLPNPFAALLEVWSTGYAFADIHDDTIHLIAAEGPPR
ncbi:hypothetical protein [Nocardia sp. NPDC056100]|uniref:hypothetical protein n=1 Tax=Nocardia sp. NPDC056100 TaxID=3345712 RepID=UPI0035DCA41B